MDRAPRSPTRRTVLGSAAGVTAAALAGPAASRAAAQTDDGPVVDLVNYAFEPGTEGALVIPPGTTVRFVWRTDGHNIVVENQPDASDWAGHEGIEDAGFEHEHTFEATGDYRIVCTPHESLGMIGDITVEEGATVGVQSGATWTPPGGDVGIAFIATVVGVIGISVLSVFAGESYASVRSRADGPSSAYTTGLAVVALATIGLVAIVARLLLAG